MSMSDATHPGVFAVGWLGLGFVAGSMYTAAMLTERGTQAKQEHARVVVEGTLTLDVTAAVPCLDAPCDWVIGSDGGVRLRESITEIVEAAAIEAAEKKKEVHNGTFVDSGR